ncbi:MAG: N-acetyltransferase family protein [Pseudomonadota bacterium]
MKKDVEICPARAQDIGDRGDGGIRDLFNAVRRDARHQGRSPLAPPQYAQWAQMIDRQRAGAKHYQVLVARYNNEIVGFCAATHLRRKPFTSLNKIFIAASMQGAGIGRRFINLIAARSQEMGRTAVLVTAESGADRASGFYQKLGF